MTHRVELTFPYILIQCCPVANGTIPCGDMHESFSLMILLMCCILLCSDDKVNAVVDLSLCIPRCLAQCLVRLFASAAG